MLIAALLAAAGATATAPLQVVLVTREGGINPGEERLALSPDGRVEFLATRLATQVARRDAWTIGPDGVARVAHSVAQAGFFAMAQQPNAANGSLAAASWTLTVTVGARSHEVTMYRFGTPPPPETFVALIRELCALLTLDGRFPTKRDPR